MQPFNYNTMDILDVPTCLGVLRVRSSGQGAPILFWSSLLMSGRMWSAQAAYFSANYRVILIDPPGHGDSQALTQRFEFSQCAQCLVLDALGIQRSHYAHLAALENPLEVNALIAAFIGRTALAE